MSATDHLGDPQFTTIKEEIDAQIAKRGTPDSRHPPRPGQLVHGTSMVMHSGNQLRPGFKSNWAHMGKSADEEQTHVYATGDLIEGYHFAQHAAHMHSEDEGDYGPLPAPHIYEVTPKGRMTYDPEVRGHAQGYPVSFNRDSDEPVSSYRSRQPLVVGREVSKLARREHMENFGQDWEPGENENHYG